MGAGVQGSDPGHLGSLFMGRGGIPGFSVPISNCPRVEEEHRKKQQGGRDPGANPNDDPYGGSTDENTEDEGQSPSDQPIPELPGRLRGGVWGDLTPRGQ